MEKTIKKFHEDYFDNLLPPKLNALSFIKNWFATPGLDFVVNETEILNDNAPEYFKKLGPLLDKTDNSIIANYVVFGVI